MKGDLEAINVAAYAAARGRDLLPYAVGVIAEEAARPVVDRLTREVAELRARAEKAEADLAALRTAKMRSKSRASTWVSRRAATRSSTSTAPRRRARRP